MTAVVARGLTKQFGVTRALDGVDLEVAEGEVRGLLGPNGAGKTTLLRMLLGLVRADAGTISLLGRAPVALEPLTLEGVAGIVEEPCFYPYLSGRANLELLAELDDPGAGARIDDVLERLGLTGRAADRAGSYSSGLRQRLGVAAALMRADRLVLFDEPTGGLDPAGARLIEGLIRRLRADGVAVLVSSHQIAEVEAVCDGFTVLSEGRVVWDGSATEMRREAPPPSYHIATSDDRRALKVAAGQDRVHAGELPSGGLAVEADEAAVDRFVLALAQAGVAIRRLELAMSPLESLFFTLTGQGPRDGPAPSGPAQAAGLRS